MAYKFVKMKNASQKRNSPTYACFFQLFFILGEEFNMQDLLLPFSILFTIKSHSRGQGSYRVQYNRTFARILKFSSRIIYPNGLFQSFGEGGKLETLFHTTRVVAERACKEK
jgi:hypothetical protein